MTICQAKREKRCQGMGEVTTSCITPRPTEERAGRVLWREGVPRRELEDSATWRVWGQWGQAPTPLSFLQARLGPQVTWELQREQHAISVFRGCQHPLSHTCCSQISQPDFFLQPPVLIMIKYSWIAVMPAYFVKFQIPFFKRKLFFFFQIIPLLKRGKRNDKCQWLKK